MPLKDLANILTCKFNHSKPHVVDPLNYEVLDWRKRFIVIEEISQGLLYLHKDSRLRIILKDLKASNLNPKISYFGTTRIFRGN